MQGHSDDEEEEEVAEPVGLQKEAVPPPPPPPPDQAQVNMMKLSVQALHGMPGEGTLSVQSHIAG
jgi:hypothetical protein